jgi:protoporphyrinogen oxidase
MPMQLGVPLVERSAGENFLNSRPSALLESPAVTCLCHCLLKRAVAGVVRTEHSGHARRYVIRARQEMFAVMRLSKCHSVAVIGAGPAGLTAAYELSKSLSSVDVYEASDAVGGLSRSLSLWGQTVDLGPHRFFSHDRRVNELWLEVVGRDYVMVNRLTRILYQGRFFDYPLSPVNALMNLGPIEAARCVASYIRSRCQTRAEPENFEEWVSDRFGQRLYEHFFKSYSEKLWGIPCQELDVDFASQRIKGFSLGAALKSAFSRDGRSQHKTLVDQFAYPVGGTGMVYQRMARDIEASGGHIFLNSPIRRVVTECGRAVGVELHDGKFKRYEAIISSMPLTHLVRSLRDAPSCVVHAASQLSFRNTILVYLDVESEHIFSDNWIYVQSPGLRVGRITNFRNWAPQLCRDRKTTIVALEYWCNEGDKTWRQCDEQLIAEAKRDLAATSLAATKLACEHGKVCRIPQSYPVYRKGYRQLLEPIKNHLSAIDGLLVIGRYGAFKYNNQDHSILMGLMAAENVLGAACHDLWSVNCDYDAYQEGCLITETGLVAVNQGSI